MDDFQRSGTISPVSGLGVVPFNMFAMKLREPSRKQTKPSGTISIIPRLQGNISNRVKRKFSQVIDLGDEAATSSDRSPYHLNISDLVRDKEPDINASARRLGGSLSASSATVSLGPTDQVGDLNSLPMSGTKRRKPQKDVMSPFDVDDISGDSNARGAVDGRKMSNSDLAARSAARTDEHSASNGGRSGQLITARKSRGKERAHSPSRTDGLRTAGYRIDRPRIPTGSVPQPDGSPMFIKDTSGFTPSPPNHDLDSFLDGHDSSDFLDNFASSKRKTGPFA